MTKYSKYIIIKDTDSQHVKDVYFENNKYLGRFIQDVDGFYYYWPDEDLSGCWSEFSLKCIAAALQEINKEWTEQINNDLKNDKIL